MRLTVNEILRSGAEARLPVGTPDTEVEGAFVDSREVVPGALFVGVRGEAADGGQHAPDALRDGAAAAVVGESAWRWIEGECLGMRRPVVVAPDPVAVLQAAGRLALERSGAGWWASPAPRARPRPRTSWSPCCGRRASPPRGPLATATRRSASRCP